MNNEMKSSLTAVDTWTRGLFMLLFVVIYSVAEFVLGAVVFFQFVNVLATREVNERLQEFTTDVSVFIYQILQFLTFNSEVKPYPFAPWPDGPADLESLDMLDNIQESDELDTDTETEIQTETVQAETAQTGTTNELEPETLADAATETTVATTAATAAETTTEGASEADAKIDEVSGLASRTVNKSKSDQAD